MMTPKMKEDLCTQILNASRQLFLSSKISEVCQEKGTQKQLEFILELMNEELTLRDKNRRKRLIKRAGFPTYKTFEGYSYQHVKLPPAFSREELESLEFVPEQKNLVLYGPVGVGKTHMAIAAGVKACNLGYKTKFYTVTELVLKLAESRKNGTLEKLLRDLRSLDLLILDEPVSGVDQNGLESFYQTVDELKRTNHMAILLVSHDLDVVRRYADRVVLMQGTVMRQGDPENVFDSDEFAQVFYTRGGRA